MTAQLSLLNILDELHAIWKYASLGLWSKNGGKKHKDEYSLTIIRMWDRLDKESVDTIEWILTELDGLIMKEGDPTDKALRSQITHYVEVRKEQGE